MTRGPSLTEVEEVDKTRNSVGAAVAFIAGILGIAVTFVLFLKGYRELIGIEMTAGRPDEALIVTYVIPLLADLIILGGVLWLVGGLGLATRSRWGWPAVVTASVVSLAASFFPMIPAMSRGAFPAYIYLFGPNLVFYFVLLAYVRPVDGRVLALSFFSGIASVLSFMNGVASIDKILVTGQAFYIPVQQLSWVAAVAWGVFTVGLILRKLWAHQVGLGAGLLATLAGAPLAVVSTLEAGRPSMFTPAPALALCLLVILLLPGLRGIAGGAPGEAAAASNRSEAGRETQAF